MRPTFHRCAVACRRRIRTQPPTRRRRAIAHFERRRTGRGQHVDIAAQQSLTLGTQFRVLGAALGEAPARRLAGGVYVAGRFLPLRYPLRDGWVALGPAFLPSTGHFMKRLLKWALEEDSATAALDEDWGQFVLRVLRKELSVDVFAPIDDLLRAFFATRTKAEAVEAACKRKLLLAPVFDLGEFADSPQLAARGFARELAVDEAGATLCFPGPFARFERTPIRYPLAPPRLDAHGAALRAEAPRTPAPAGREADPAAPLAGVKILDLFWILAGPGATRMLADYGAEVIHVESTGHLDTLRVIPPYRFANPHPEGAGAFQCANANKLGITLDLNSREGREIALDLVRRSDVVTESFAPGVIERYGLGWETLREVKPDLVMISSCLLGQSGPWRDLTGFGNLAAAVTGFQQLACWPGSPPAGPYAAYTDFIGVRYNAIAILAALEHRNRTGLGQYIDMAQGEAALHFLAPAYLDYAAHGRVPRGPATATPSSSRTESSRVQARTLGWRSRCATTQTGVRYARRSGARTSCRAATTASSWRPRCSRGRASTRLPRSRARSRRAASPHTRCSTCRV